MIFNNQQELFTICSTGYKSCVWKCGYQVIMFLKVASEIFFFFFFSDQSIWIRDPVPFWPMDPGTGIRDGQKIKIRIRDSDPDEHRILKFFLMRIRIWNSFWPGSGTGKIRIRDKHPGSATLVGCNLTCWIVTPRCSSISAKYWGSLYHMQQP
jgi:hypothetical protein